jgi:hypothetical protein
MSGPGSDVTGHVPKHSHHLMKTLHDGREVSTHSHDWRIECLARFLLDLPFAKRREWLQGWSSDIEKELMTRMYAIADARTMAGRK